MIGLYNAIPLIETPDPGARYEIPGRPISCGTLQPRLLNGTFLVNSYNILTDTDQHGKRPRSSQNAVAGEKVDELLPGRLPSCVPQQLDLQTTGWSVQSKLPTFARTVTSLQPTESAAVAIFATSFTSSRRIMAVFSQSLEPESR